MQKVGDLKFKFQNLKENLLKQPLQIPQMGFSDTIHNASLTPDSRPKISNKDETDSEKSDDRLKQSDQEILESTEAIFFTEGVDIGVYKLKELSESGDAYKVDEIEQTIATLKDQHKVISKRVLQLILEKRSSCNNEFQNINETEKIIQESVWSVQKARSYLNHAKRHLTTSSLDILAAYKKRQTLVDVLEILKFFQELKSTNQRIQDLLQVGKYSEAISILLQTKNLSEKYVEFTVTHSLKQKLQDTLDLTEITLDNALNGISTKFDSQEYSELMNAYKLLGKTYLAMDLLHMNFTLAIHAVAFNVVKEKLDQIPTDQKLLFEQMVEQISLEALVPCLTQLSKSFWKILVCYYQVKLWHQNYKLYKSTEPRTNDQNEDLIHDEYVQEKLSKGQVRIWNDIQAKICIFINSTGMCNLKYESFMQVLTIVNKLKKIGLEFCNDDSQKLMSSLNSQSVEFFKRYHISCLEEVNLFIELEMWQSIQVQPAFSVLSLQEFSSVKRALKRYNALRMSKNEPAILPLKNSPSKRLRETDDSSAHSQDESLVCGSSCSYFVRFVEKGSPFENLFDQKMIEEDILSGIADETSCYFSEESSENENENNRQTSIEDKTHSELTVNNTTLNIFRIIGRYLKMCRSLSAISPHIICFMTELIDFYFYAVYEIFTKDLTVPGEAIHTEELSKGLKRISETVIPKIPKWPPPKQSTEPDLNDSEQLAKCINAIESCHSITQQFAFLHGYLDHLIETTQGNSAVNEREALKNYIEISAIWVKDLRKPIFICITTKAIDINATIVAINKIKWDISHVMVQHNSYIDVLNRATQIFAMRLEELSQTKPIPKELWDSLWDSYCHIATHVLVEGYSNAKKCTAAGRALMQLDFTHFMSVLELLSGLKFPVHKQYVDQYLKAYYLGSSLEEFITTQQSYSNKQLAGLINCAVNDKKLRQKLLTMTEDSSNPKN